MIYLSKEDPTFRPHLVRLLKEFQPRQYVIGRDDFIQDQFEEVFEVLYIMKGKVGVGYRLFNEVFLGMALKDQQVINDYAIIQEKVSEFIYKPILEKVEGLALKRSVFKEFVEEPFWKKFLPFWTGQYLQKIQKPMVEHRQEMADKFANRIDYVALSAFGVGIEEDNNPIENQMKDFHHYICKFQGDGLLIAKLKMLDQYLYDTEYQLLLMSMKYDTRMQLMVKWSTKNDGTNTVSQGSNIHIEEDK